MSALPLVLAGPIVRRVDSRSASVWVALSEPVDAVEIRLFEGLKTSTGPGTVDGGDAPFAAGSAQTKRMGEHLHLALAVADGSEEAAAGDPSKRFTLRPGGIFSYDLIFHRAGQPDIGLKGLGLLEDDPVDADPSHAASSVRHIAGVLPEAPRHLALGYETDRLPSFVLPAPILADIRIAQTSCRKSHGPGSDALAWLDGYIGERIDKADQRIQQLFLTGDQIYADDVPCCMLPMYHDLALRIMGDGGPAGEEELPTGPQAAVRNSTVNMETAPPMRRTVLVRSDGGFTSVESQNHLMTVGEYAAACLTAWSPHAWGALGDEERVYGTTLGPSAFTLTDLTRIFWREKENGPGGSVQAARTRLKELHGPTFAAERQKVLVFASTVGKVARVLANTATYMIFDDHDVTDDWNLNRQWRNRVYSRPLGRSIVRNALIVYSFFQGWGSDWRSYANPNEKNGRILAVAERYLATVKNRPQRERDALDVLFDFSGNEKPEDRADFHYEAPGSLYGVRVLDSRTRRANPVSYTGAAALLGDSLDRQVPKEPTEAGSSFWIFVASTPLLGPEVMEQFLLPLAVVIGDAVRLNGMQEDTDPLDAHQSSAFSLASKRTNGAAFADVETWPSNPPSQHQLLSRLAAWGHAVVLGGDVHYGDNLFVDWWEWDRRVGEPSRKTGRVVQLTASAARNALETRVEAIYRGYHWLNLWIAGNAIEGFGIRENAESFVRLPQGQRPSLARLRRLHEDPAILPAHGWPAGTRLDQEPDWWFRQVQVRDERSDGDRTGPYKDLAGEMAGGIAAVAAAAGLERSRKAAGAHALAALRGFAPRREMVMTNNVGIVSFAERTENGRQVVSVIHELLSSDLLDYPENEVNTDLPTKRPLGVTAKAQSGAPHTRTEIPLEPAGDRPTFNSRAI